MMSTLIPFLVLNQSCDKALPWVEQQLAGAGLRVRLTFDLQAARLSHPACPHHEANDYNCQMVVLLVYREQDDPATLVIHGQDGRTWVSLAAPVGGRASQLLELSIRSVIIPPFVHAPTCSG